MSNLSPADLVDAICQLDLVRPSDFDDFLALSRGEFASARDLARESLRRGWLTAYQANQLLQGNGHALVLGPYTLLERLGEGGMGKVFKARHQSMNRLVALKILRKDRLLDPDIVRRFLREMELTSQLEHPNIVRAYDAGKMGETYYFAMEYVAGTDLHRLVTQKGALPVEQAVDYILQATRGLQHAAARGLIHRDIKPSNLIVTPPDVAAGARFGVVKILDFGLARPQVISGDASSTCTESGIVIGTPDFLSPEQARNSKQVDIRADLYSLGCTLYFLLAGRPPFLGPPLEKLIQHQVEEATPVHLVRPGVPLGVSFVVRRLMAKNPLNRHQTPGELIADLESWTGQDVRMPTEAAPSNVTSADEPLPVQGQKVLAVDDDPIIGRMLERFLTQEGFTVKHCLDGDAALKLALAEPFSLVILDVNMHGMTGFELLVRLRTLAAYQNVPIVMLTTKGAEKDIVHGFELGADDYMLKPFSPGELLARLRRLLRRR